MPALRSILFLVLCVSCLDPFRPPPGNEFLGFLVVDGYINADGSAAVRLARSVPLAHAEIYPSERNAIVTIESSSGKTFNLTEIDSATYVASGLAIDAADRFTLHIKTTDGNEYQSDEVQSYPTPPVDSIFFTINEARDLLEVRVNAHDPNPDATRLYLWDVVETYQYHAARYAGQKIVNGKPVDIPPEEVPYMCWRDIYKESVLLSTKNLTESVISKYAVARVEKGSEKLMIRYSVLVKQRAISEAEYAFRTQLQNSTEQQGSLFSVIPGTVVGNIHSTNPDEYVLGYFRGQDVKERRIFIDYSDLPKDFQILGEIPPDCQARTSCQYPGGQGGDCTRVENLGDVAIIGARTFDSGRTYYFDWVNADCGDCRYQGGSITRPSFWE